LYFSLSSALALGVVNKSANTPIRNNMFCFIIIVF
jgi:hypothetical protein